LDKGAAIYLDGVIEATVLTFQSCEFKEIAATNGGVVYLSFLVNKIEAPNYSLFPTVDMSSCNSTHVYASLGGLIWA